MAYDALETIKLRNDFYRDGFRKLVVILAGSVACIVGLIVIIVILMFQKPEPTYFASTDSGRIIPLVPLNQPNLTDKAILQWSGNAVVSLYSYNFVNFREVFQENKQYFTDSGWRAFVQALQDSQSLQSVQAKKLVVSAVLAGAPLVLNKYLFNGRYTWKIQMPVLVTYLSSSEQSSQKFLVTLTIQRVSTLDDINGIGIQQFVAEQR
jgi:intracellular multiplication protein IcmL